MRCSCVILNYNDSETTASLLAEIRNYQSIEHLIVVDNCSTDDSYVVLSGLSDEKISVIRTSKNGGYGYGNNFGVQYAKQHFGSTYCLIANPDVHFSESTLIREMEFLNSMPDAAVLSPIQLDRNNNRIRDIAWKVPDFYHCLLPGFGPFRIDALNYSQEYLQMPSPISVGCVPGSWLLINVDRFLEVGGYDEEIFLYYEEATIGWKLKNKGYKTYLDTSETYVHDHSVSIDKSYSDERKKFSLLVRSRLFFCEKYLANSPVKKLVLRGYRSHMKKKGFI